MSRYERNSVDNKLSHCTHEIRGTANETLLWSDESPDLELDNTTVVMVNPAYFHIAWFIQWTSFKLMCFSNVSMRRFAL